MSRKEQFAKKSNPAECTLEWAGASDKGVFRIWDKETKQEVEVASVKFAVLAERNCIRGWYEEKKCNAYSNEVASLKNQELTVRYYDNGKPRELCHGKYEDIKAEMASIGMKYNKVVYALVIEADNINPNTIVKILLKGAAASAWFDVADKQKAILCSGFLDGKKGAVKFRTPVFEVVDLDSGADEEAELAYEQVKIYLADAPSTARELPPPDVDEDGVPF